jgi:hypothetical protein
MRVEVHEIGDALLKCMRMEIRTVYLDSRVSRTEMDNKY